jgi:hypothetical protein
MVGNFKSVKIYQDNLEQELNILDSIIDEQKLSFEHDSPSLSLNHEEYKLVFEDDVGVYTYYCFLEATKINRVEGSKVPTISYFTRFKILSNSIKQKTFAKIVDAVQQILDTGSNFVYLHYPRGYGKTTACKKLHEKLLGQNLLITVNKHIKGSQNVTYGLQNVTYADVLEFDNAVRGRIFDNIILDEWNSFPSDFQKYFDEYRRLFPHRLNIIIITSP